MSDSERMNLGFNAEALTDIIDKAGEGTDKFLAWLKTDYRVQYPQVSFAGNSHGQGH